MKLRTFRMGGVHPDENKLSSEVKTVKAPLPEQAVFPAVRIQPGDADLGIADPELPAGAVCQTDAFQNALFSDTVTGFPQRNMC